MAIYKMVGNKERLDKVAPTTFGQEGVLERSDLQRILRDQPEVLEEGLLIIAEEFGNWQGSGRRIDLMGIDASGRLVVIELKRDNTAFMDLQAIRYAAMLSTLTFTQIAEAHGDYLRKRGRYEDPQDNINRHLEFNALEGDKVYTEQPRIILASGDFQKDKELTTAILWLNQNSLDIKCVQLQPYKNGSEVLIESSQVIPLPGTEEFIVKSRERSNETRERYGGQGQWVDGGRDFEISIDSASERLRGHLRRLYEWAVELEKDNVADLSTWQGKNVTLAVNVRDESSLVSVYNNGSIRFWPNGFNRLASNSVPLVDELIGSDLASGGSNPVGRALSSISNLENLLATLTEAYREANGLLVVEEEGSTEQALSGE